MTSIVPARGMQDWLPERQAAFDWVWATLNKISARYGYAPVSTPIVEPKELFERGAGATSDVVSKEMFEIVSRKEDQEPSFVLRPEGTAPLARMILNQKLTSHLPLRLSYCGPMFRYERPQKGRLRQFHHVGIEALGLSESWADVEVIACAMEGLHALGIQEGLTLEINTLGDVSTRLLYTKRLREHFQKVRDQLSQDSQRRLESNVLRILDSKAPQDRPFIENAPLLKDSLTHEAGKFFDDVLRGLESLGISYKLSEHLVRGLDYYTHTVFEITSPALGSQSTLLAGGRYDGLLETLGGPPCPGVGWAAGVERLLLILEGHNKNYLKKPLLALAGEEPFINQLMLWASQLRQEDLSCVMVGTGSWRSLLKQVDRCGVAWALLLGEREAQEKVVILKSMVTGQQQTLAWDQLVAVVQKTIGSV